MDGVTALQRRILGTPLPRPRSARFAVCMDGVVALLRRSGHSALCGWHPELTAGFTAHHDARRALVNFWVGTWPVCFFPWADVPTRLLVELGRLYGHGAATPDCPLLQALNHNTLPSIWRACSWLPRAQLGRTCARCPSRTSRLG